MLKIPYPPLLLSTLQEAYINSHDLSLILTTLMTYTIDYAVATRVGVQEPNIMEYDMTGLLSTAIDTHTLVTIVEKYAMAVLNELTLCNINNPYLVSVDEYSFTIGNKEEY